MWTLPKWKHSSRMRTVCLPTASHSVLRPMSKGVPTDIPTTPDIPTPRAYPPHGHTHPRQTYLPLGHTQAHWKGPGTRDTHPLERTWDQRYLPRGQTHTYENITLPQLRLLTLKMFHHEIKGKKMKTADHCVSINALPGNIYRRLNNSLIGCIWSFEKQKTQILNSNCCPANVPPHIHVTHRHHVTYLPVFENSTCRSTYVLFGSWKWILCNSSEPEVLLVLRRN